MADTAKGRHRRLWLVAVAVLLPVLGGIAWRYRPLNPTEKLLVGRWRAPTEDLEWSFPMSVPRRHLQAIRFTADRRYRYRSDFLYPLETGSWQVVGSSLHLVPDPVGPWSFDRVVFVAKRLIGQHPARRVYQIVLASPPEAFHMESPSHSVYWTPDTDGRGVPLVDDRPPSDEPVYIGLPYP